MAQVDLNAGLVAYYPFNGNTNDASGNGHHGTSYGAVLTTDQFGNANSAYLFDGVNDFIEVLDNGGFGTDNVSIALWFKTTSPDLQTFIGKENFNTATGAIYQVSINWTDEPGVLFNLVGDDNKMPCDEFNSTSSYVSGGSMPFSMNQWHCLVATFDGTIQKIYVDGILVAAVYPKFTGIRKCQTPIRFGQWYSGSQPFKGVMDEVRFYNRALNEEEIMTLCPENPASIKSGFTYQLKCNKDVTFTDVTELTAPATPSWSWNFGDGGTSREQHPVHHYATPGTYRVKLEIINMGKRIRVTKDVVVPVSQPPVISAGNDTTVCENAMITLKGSGKGTYAWEPATGLDDPTKAEPSVTITGDILFKLSVTGADGCTAEDEVMITVRQSPALPLQDQTICNLDTIQLSVTGGAQYQWSPALGLSNATIGNPRAYPAATTKYEVMLQDAFNCTFKDDILITVKPTPKVAKSTDQFNICAGDSVKLDLTTYVTGGTSYNWTPAAGLSNPAGNAPKASPANNTRYIVDISNQEGCHNYDTLQVNVLALPTLSLRSKEMTICVADTVQLQASGNGIRYSWTPAAFMKQNDVPNPEVYPKQNTFFVVTAANADNCIRKDSVNVLVKEHHVFSLQPLKTSLCIGEDVELTVTGGDKYIWDNIAGLSDYTSAKVTATPLVTSTYQVTAIESVCRDTVDMFAAITVHPLPDVRAVSDVPEINCAIPTAQLKASGALSYKWTPGKGLSDSVIAAPVAWPDEAVMYTVTGTDINGCSNTAMVQLGFAKIGENKLALPTAFSPNGDGKNDCFGIKRLGSLLQKGELSVYNRWGELVYQTTSSSRCWDGTYKGKPADIGTYVYYLKGETVCGPLMRKGTITLLR